MSSSSGKGCFLGLVPECLLQFLHRLVILRSGLYGTWRCKQNYLGDFCWWGLDLNVTLCDYSQAIRLCRESSPDAFKHRLEFAVISMWRPILFSLFICVWLCLLPKRMNNSLMLLYWRSLSMNEKKAKYLALHTDLYVFLSSIGIFFGNSKVTGILYNIKTYIICITYRRTNHFHQFVTNKWKQMIN